MSKRKHTSEFELTERDAKFMQKVAANATPDFVRSMSVFLLACERNGYSKKVSAAAFSAFMLSNLVKLLALASGVQADELDRKALGDITCKVQETLATLVSEWIDKGNERSAAEFN